MTMQSAVLALTLLALLAGAASSIALVARPAVIDSPLWAGVTLVLWACGVLSAGYAITAADVFPAWARTVAAVEILAALAVALRLMARVDGPSLRHK